MDIRFHRNLIISDSVAVIIFSLLMMTFPPLMIAGGANIRIIACTTVLLPLPDSPTSPNISPELISNETSRTALMGMVSVM